MIYDLLKILKKVLKYSFVLVITLVAIIVGYVVSNKKSYNQNSSYSFTFIDKSDFVYYEYAQEQIINEIMLNHFKFENAIEKEFDDVNITISKKTFYEVACINVSLEMEDESADSDNIQVRVVEYIEQWVKNNVLTEYQNVCSTSKVTRVEYHGLTEEVSHNSLIAKIGLFVLICEVGCLVVLGLCDGRIISKGELEEKFGLNVVVDSIKDAEFANYVLKSENKGSVRIFYCEGTENFDSCEGLRDLSLFETKKALINCDKVYICVKLKRTKEKEVSMVLDFLNGIEVNNRTFIVQ